MKQSRFLAPVVAVASPDVADAMVRSPLLAVAEMLPLCALPVPVLAVAEPDVRLVAPTFVLAVTVIPPDVASPVVAPCTVALPVRTAS